MPPGAHPFKFRKEGEPPRIVLTSAPAKPGFVELRVSDEGVGFEAREAGLLFKPFSQLHPRGRFEGAGLGLATCRRIAVRHGGEISASGQAGKGATVVVSLPASTPAA